MDHVNVLASRAGTFQRVDCGGEQTVGDEAVEPAHDDSKAQTLSAQAAFDLVWLKLFGHCWFVFFLYFPLNCAALFSKKAFVPSRMSSVAHASPKSVASRNKPSSWGISTPRSMASMAYFTASGAFAIIFFAMASAAGRSSAGS